MQRLSRDYLAVRLNLSTPTAASVGVGFLFGENMSYSRAYKEDVFNHIITRKDTDGIFRSFVGADVDEKFKHEAIQLLKKALPFLDEVISCGAVWSWDEHQYHTMSIRYDTVQDVFGMLMTLQSDPNTGECTFTDESLKRSRKWGSSYYLKHVAEWLRQRRGMVPYYVSNGEYIIAHTLFLKYASLIEEDGRGLSRLVRPTHGPNMNLRLPSIFGILEEFYDGRY